MGSIRASLLAPVAVLLVSASGAASAFAVGPENSLDSRGWELVSPGHKSGGEVGRPGDEGAGVFAAAAAGGAFAFAANDSFVDGAGAPPVSQYLATRSGDGWATANVSPPLLAGTYAGGAYQSFSADLTRSLLSNGWSCPDGAAACAAQNPPLGAGAPAGYRILYLRSGSGFQSLLTVANSPALTVPAADFALSLQGTSPDLQHVVIATCAGLTADATEVAGPSGCDPAETNLYRWSGGTLSAVNLLPAQVTTAPGASLAAPVGAVSSDGSRVYWSHEGDLYLREGPATQLVAADAEFQAASADGGYAVYLKAGHARLFRASGGPAEDLTPAGGVQGVLAAMPSEDPFVYYLTASGLFLAHAGAEEKIADGADSSNLPPATGTAQLSADGRRLAFVSSASLTGFANAGKPEVYVYDAAADRLLCVSCNPFGTVPLGPASLPGARAAAEGPASYRPRALLPTGNRLFFETVDRLLAADSDGLADVYQWSAQGTGGCAAVSGCIGLISHGRAGADSFLDASADGTDVFFLTSASLVGIDGGGLDVYDARAGGGFQEPVPVVPCEGDACQGLVPGPTDLNPATATVQGQVNPPASFAEEKKSKKPKAKKKKKGKKRAGKSRGSRRGQR